MDLSRIGVNANKQKQFASRGIYSVEDLLQYLPRTYKDFRRITGILPDNQISIFKAQILSCKTVNTGKTPFITATCIEEQSGQTVTVRWFNMPWYFREVSAMAANKTRVIIAGKVDYNSTFGYGISQPEVFEQDRNTLRIYPVYRAIPHMSADYLYEKMNAAITLGLADSEVLPRDKEVEQGRKRILFNDLLYFALHNELNHAEVSAGSQYNVKSWTMVNKIIEALPFTLTEDQNKAVQDMLRYAEAGRRIQALVQGDTGAGKTQIAVIVAAAFIDSGYQAVIMAPTQVLAKQHYDSISASLAPYGVNTVYLDSTLKKKERDGILKLIADGSAQLIIGTHSCVGKDVVYKDLALTIVDEEHRFGVKQRAAIIEKAAKGVHSITMSATPIPRSLAQVVYGDEIQLHTIKTMPSGRKPVKTRVFKKQLGNMKFILKEVQAGHQAYVVCPMIETNEKAPELKSVEVVSKEYKDFLEPYGVRIATLTGKTGAEETEETINRFKNGDVDVLIATTVIEVGVNVPNATVMVITNAERFGLSSLHQLRGRVGRSDLQSYCILQSEDETEKGLARLQVMCDTTDGFKIAEADLQQRGAGDLLGTQQSGDNKYVSLMIANPERYQDALTAAKELIRRGKDCCPMMEQIMEERMQEC